MWVEQTMEELMRKRQAVRFVTLMSVVWCLLLSLVAVTGAQPKGKKEFAFRGKVEKVDANAKSLTVNNEAIPGWMGAMSMAYKVDKADEVVKVVKVGDQITAKVYEGDFTLYEVRVVPPKK